MDGTDFNLAESASGMKGTVYNGGIVSTNGEFVFEYIGGGALGGRGIVSTAEPFGLGGGTEEDPPIGRAGGGTPGRPVAALSRAPFGGGDGRLLVSLVG